MQRWLLPKDFIQVSVVSSDDARMKGRCQLVHPLLEGFERHVGGHDGRRQPQHTRGGIRILGLKRGMRKLNR